MDKIKKNFFKEYFTKKRILGILGMLVQIIIVLAVLVGIIYKGKDLIDKYGVEEKKITSNKQSEEKETSAEDEEDKEVDTKEEKYDGDYYLYVNTRYNAVIVYGYDENGDKFPIKIMGCTVGPDLKKGTYKVTDNYSWVSLDDKYWNQYNTKVGENFWIQSIRYRARNKYSLVVSEYNRVGETNTSGNAVRLRAGDASWIYKNCKEGTVVKVGNTKELPLKEPRGSHISSLYGWDPTDPNRSNPWKDKAKGKIAAYDGVIKVERGSEVNYLANLVAYNKKGKNVLKELQYEPFDSNIECTAEVTYTYGKGKNRMKAKLTYKVIDTIPPVVSIDTSDKNLFTLKIPTAKFTKETLNSDDTKWTITENIKSAMKVTDLGEEIGIMGFEIIFPETIYSGKNLVQVKVEDAAGNVTYAGVNITIKEKKAPAQMQTVDDQLEEQTKKKKK